MFTSKICIRTIISLAILLFTHSAPLHSQSKSITIKDTVKIAPSAFSSASTQDASGCPYDSAVSHWNDFSGDVQTEISMPTDGIMFVMVTSLNHLEFDLFINGEKVEDYSGVKKYGPFAAGTLLTFRMHLHCNPEYGSTSDVVHYYPNDSYTVALHYAYGDCIATTVGMDVTVVNMNHIEVDPFPQEITNGEESGIEINLINDEGNSIWPEFPCHSADEIPIPLTITAEPPGYGHFETEESVGDSGPFQFTLANALSYVADGTQPDSAQTIAFTVTSVDDPSKTGTGTMVIQRPNCPKVVLSKEQINPGDTIDVTMKRKFMVGTEEEYPAGTRFNINILEGEEYGSLLANEELSSSLCYVEMPVKFVAVGSIDADSVVISIQGTVNLYGCGGETSILSGNDTIRESMPAMSRKSTKVSSVAKREVQARRSSSNIGRQAVNEFECGDPVDTVVIKKKGFEILLGESRYYYVVQKDDILSIHETLNPSMPSTVDGTLITDASVWSSDPVTIASDKPNSGRRLGMYWETLKPKPVGTGDLPAGMIRLIGRYWTADSVYKVKLTANYSDITGSITVGVKKPVRLLTLQPLQSPTYRLSRDVEDNEINIDDTCIVYGGKYGIPPQFLKGQMFQEAGKKNFPGYTGFTPSYRYEPFNRYQQLSSAWTTDKLYKDKLWFVDSIRTVHKMGLGKDVPIHHHILDMDYPKSPKTVWDILYDHSELVNTGSTKEHRVYGKRLPNGKMIFPSQYEDINEKYNSFLNASKKYNEFLNVTGALTSLFSTKSKEEIAREKMIKYLRDEWEGGAKNMVAQTRLASSYGLLQMTYDKAVRYAAYPSNNSAICPEDFNVTSTNMDYSMKYMKKILREGLTSSVEEQGNWSNGFEHWFRNYVWPIWNTGRATPEGKYAKDIYSNTQKFKPQNK